MPAQVPTVKMYDTYEAGLADRPDAVLIGTPPWLHIPQAMQAIRAGCHVLSEKPLSDSTDGIDDLAALAAAEHKKVMVALCFRYHDGLSEGQGDTSTPAASAGWSRSAPWWASTCPTCDPTTAASSRRSMAGPSI